jgi:hypothetical protein
MYGGSVSVSGSGSGNDLIIDEGFAVLNDFRPCDGRGGSSGSSSGGGGGGGGTRTEEGAAAGRISSNATSPSLPRRPFASYANALSIPSVECTTSLLSDCALVFDARTRSDACGYSTGSTYFLPCTMRPRCALEGLACRIFRAHADSLRGGGGGEGGEGGEDWGEDTDVAAAGGKDVDEDDDGKRRRASFSLFDPERSGAEWWTLVLDAPGGGDGGGGGASPSKDDEDDEVGMHFDADYGASKRFPQHTGRSRRGCRPSRYYPRFVLYILRPPYDFFFRCRLPTNEHNKNQDSRSNCRITCSIRGSRRSRTSPNTASRR